MHLTNLGHAHGRSLRCLDHGPVTEEEGQGGPRWFMRTQDGFDLIMQGVLEIRLHEGDSAGIEHGHLPRCRLPPSTRTRSTGVSIVHLPDAAYTR